MDLESADDELEALVATLRTLPQMTQRVFVLRKVYSWSHEQIAAGVDLSEAAVVQHLVVAALTCMRSERWERSARGGARSLRVELPLEA